MMFWNLIEKIRAKSSVLGVFTLCIGIVLLSWSVFSGQPLDRKWITLTSASAVYLLLRKRFLNLEITPLRKLLKNDAVPLILNILYVIAVCFTVITVLTSNVYIMPFGYYISAVAACLFIALDIFFMPKEETRYNTIILAKIIIVSLLLIWAPYYKFPNKGTDPWYHMALVNDIVEGSHIPLTGHAFYKDFPAMHLIVAIINGITSLDVMTSMMLIGLIEAVMLLFLFCTGKIIVNKRVGLLATLFVATSNTWIFWMYYLIPMSIGLGFLLIEIYLIIKSLKTRKMEFKVLSLLLPLAVIYTQPIPSIILLIILVSMYLGDFLLSLISGKPVHADLRFSMPIYLGLTSFSYFMYVSGHFFTEITSTIKYVVSPQVFEAPIPPLGYAIVSFFLENLGSIVLMGLAIIGILCILDYRQDDKYGLKLVSICLGISAIVYPIHLFGKVEFLLPERWWLFIYPVASIPAGIATIWIYNTSKGRLMKLSGVTLIFLLLFPSMLFASLPTLTTALVDEKGILRGYFYDSELVAAYTISEFYDGKIVSDAFLSNYLQWTLGEKTENIYPFIVNGSEVNGILVVRSYIFNHMFDVYYEEKVQGRATYTVVLNETQRDMVKDLAENPRFNIVYYNDQVVSYLAVPPQDGPH